LPETKVQPGWGLRSGLPQAPKCRGEGEARGHPSYSPGICGAGPMGRQAESNTRSARFIGAMRKRTQECDSVFRVHKR